MRAALSSRFLTARKFFVRITCGLVLLYLCSLAYAAAFADRMIFPYVPPSYVDDEAIFLLTTAAGDQIAACYFDAADAEHLLLYSHGNGEDLGHVRPLLEYFQARGIAVLAYDYPGYGSSSGEASEDGTYAAADAAFTYATETHGWRPGQITLYGRSLGSGPSCWLAARYPVQGLILEGAFSSTFRVITRAKIIPWDRFDNLSRFSAIRCPTLLIHGTRDQTVPFAHALQNWEAIQGEKFKLWVEGAGHNDLIERAGSIYWDAVLNFIQKSVYMATS